MTLLNVCAQTAETASEPKNFRASPRIKRAIQRPATLQGVDGPVLPMRAAYASPHERTLLDPAAASVSEPPHPVRHERDGFWYGVEQVDNFLKRTADKLAAAANLRAVVLAEGGAT